MSAQTNAQARTHTGTQINDNATAYFYKVSSEKQRERDTTDDGSACLSFVMVAARQAASDVAAVYCGAAPMLSQHPLTFKMARSCHK